MASGSLANMSATIGVLIVPGHTALMQIPLEAYSSAALLVSPITPCLDAWYIARPGMPIRPPIEEFSGRDVYLFLQEKPCRQTGAPKHRRQRYAMLLQPLCPKIGYLELIAHDLSEAMSMTNRYRTSCLSSRSQTSLIF